MYRVRLPWAIPHDRRESQLLLSHAARQSGQSVLVMAVPRANNAGICPREV